MRVLVTGGCGFVGSHLVRQLLGSRRDVSVVNLDLLTYAAHPATQEELARLAPDRYRFAFGDVADDNVRALFERERFDAVIHCAAESHVDRSILEPAAFVRTNIKGTETLLAAARGTGVRRFVQVSTDEVYGPLGDKSAPFDERAALQPTSPYAASKASADLLALACQRTYRQHVCVVRAVNAYGPNQFPEKFIPLTIVNALEALPIPIYGDGRQRREWIHVDDFVAAIVRVLDAGVAGEVYNVSSGVELENAEVARRILSLTGASSSLLRSVGDRSGHDRRYALADGKIRSALQWRPERTFEEALAETVRWYRDRRSWWKALRDENYDRYYRRNYGPKGLDS